MNFDTLANLRDFPKSMVLSSNIPGFIGKHWITAQS